MRTSFPLRVLTAPVRGRVAGTMVGTVVCTVLGSAVVAGCGSGDDQAGQEPGAGGETTSTSTSSDRPAAGSSAGPAAEVESKVAVAPADLADFSCVRQPNGRWKARGEVTNSAAAAMVYTVTVVTTDSDDRVLGERIKSFELAEGQSREFTWARFYRGAADDCMPHVQREPA